MRNRSGQPWRPCIAGVHLHEPTATESTSVVAGSQEEVGGQGVTANKYEISSGGRKNV